MERDDFKASVMALAFCPCAEPERPLLAAAAWVAGPAVEIYSPLDSQTQLRPLYGHGDGVWKIAWHPTRREILTCCNDNTARVFDADTESLIRGGVDDPDFCFPTAVGSGAYSDDGRFLAVGNQKGILRLYDTASGYQLLDELVHGGAVRTIRWHGGRCASAGDTGEIRIYDAEAKREEQTIRAHSKSISDLAFSPDGSCLVSASDDGTVRVHPIHLRALIEKASSLVVAYSVSKDVWSKHLKQLGEYRPTLPLTEEELSRLSGPSPAGRGASIQTTR